MGGSERDGRDAKAQLDAALARRTAQREKIALLVQAWRASVRGGAASEPSAELIDVLDRETLALDELDLVTKQLEAEWLVGSAG